MTIDFRCENCGKMLSVDDQPGNAVRCPHCRKKVTVPEGLAGLPRPHVPPNARPATAAPSGGQAQGQDDGRQDEQDEEEPVEGQAVMGAMATIMPWVISVFLHVGVCLIMLFFVMAVVDPKIPIDIIVPDAALNLDTPGGVMDPKTDTASKSQNERRTVVKRYTKREDQVDKGKTEKTIELLAASSEGAHGGAADLGLTASDAAGGPRSRFFGSGGNAYHIVYVVDRSGSMAMSSAFELVKIEMLKSISQLKQAQDFSIILFADNQCIEGPQKRLVSAELVNKIAANNFLKDITASSTTTVLPALKRAFQLLKYAEASKPGRLVYLLSDGDFAGISGGSEYTGADGRVLNGNEAAIQWLRDNNPKDEKKGLVHVNTFLYLSKDEEARKVMETIAKENGGRFKLISADE
jgi:DNA-directed RNA polymerase subunit RPC12/RpoP/Mg-chelatase subunit ChlD